MNRKIPINRKRIPYFALLMLFLFLWCGYRHYYPAPGDPATDTISNPLSYGMFAIMSLIAGLFYWADYLHNALRKKAGLTITDEGLDDRTSIYSMGRTKWSDISGVEMRQVAGIDLLLIRLYEPEKHISRHPFWKRRMLSAWAVRYGTPVIISQRRLAFDIRALMTMLEEQRSGYLTNPV